MQNIIWIEIGSCTGYNKLYKDWLNKNIVGTIKLYPNLYTCIKDTRFETEVLLHWLQEQYQDGEFEYQCKQMDDAKTVSNLTQELRNVRLWIVYLDGCTEE